MHLGSKDIYFVQGHLAKFTYKPLISIVAPVYNTKKEWLVECIKSVQNQIYTNWELCLVDDGSNSDTSNLIDSFKDDPKIKISHLPTNLGIAVASNKAIDMATGDYIAFLDSDDYLFSSALYFIAESLNKNRDYKLLYTDDVIQDEINNQKSPSMKPNWSPDYINSCNYVNHLSVYDANLVKKLKIRTGFEGSQDYDLLLRVVDSIKPSEICHIPVSLYAWRLHQKSLSGQFSSYAVEKGIKAISEHLERLNRKGSVLYQWPHYRIKYEISTPAPHVDIIIPSINKNNILFSCIQNLLAKTNYANYTINLAVNDSIKDLVTQIYAKLVFDGKIKFHPNEEPFNFAKINNVAIDACDGPYVCLYNDDVEPLTNDWLDELVSFVQWPETGFVGSKLLYPDLKVQHAGVVLGLNGYIASHIFQYFMYNNYSHGNRLAVASNYIGVTAACSIVKKDLYVKLGGLDENLSVAYNDVDICIKAVKEGYFNVYNPFSVLLHHESFSRGIDDSPEKQIRFANETAYMLNRYGKLLMNDPFYNPNATLERGDFSLAKASRYISPWLLS